MSKFFRSADSSTSDSGSSSDSESLNDHEDDPHRSGQGDVRIDVSQIQLGDAVDRSIVPTGQTYRKDLMAHALLEDKCINDVRAELSSTAEAEIQAEAKLRYLNVSAQLIRAGFLAPSLNGDEHAVARSQFRQGLGLLGHNANTRKGSAEVRAPIRKLLTGASPGPSLSIQDFSSLQLAQIPTTVPSALTHLVTQRSTFGNSRYKQDFEELGVLGKGGYGVVYSCRHKLDGVTYAVKKVPLSASRRERIIVHGQAEIDALVSEVRTLAQLDHPNIVRYFNGWIDWINVDEPILKSSDKAQLGAEVTSFSDGISFGRVITDSDDDDNHIAFEKSASNDTASTARSDSDSIASEKALRRTGSHGTHATVSEEDIESILRQVSEPSSSMPTGTDGIRLDNAGPQLALHMQMAMYPMTLTSFLSTESPAFSSEAMSLRHCFHLQPSIRILLAILEGVDYLHRNGMVHRDLKPGNVFMAPCHDARSEGSIDLFSCDGCLSLATDVEDTVAGAEHDTVTSTSTSVSRSGTASMTTENDYALTSPLTHDASKGAIRVRIGDFGLVTALAQESPSSPDSSPPVGTQLYRAPSVSNTSPALDIYALGIIAFELLWPFGTRMERLERIHALRDGSFPSGFGKRIGDVEGRMEECIRLMLGGRGAIGEVRECLVGMLY